MIVKALLLISISIITAVAVFIYARPEPQPVIPQLSMAERVHRACGKLQVYDWTIFDEKILVECVKVKGVEFFYIKNVSIPR